MSCCAWACICGARGRFLPGAQIVPWAFAIARRLLIDMHRRTGREVVAVDDDASALSLLVALDARADDVAIAKELASRIAAVLARLPENQRVAFELIKRDGLSVAEAAEMLGATVPAVKLRAHRAYEALRAEHGFRALDYSIDADAASPRACVQFSEDLAKGRVDFAPFVVLKGVDQPAVTAEAQQICVDGLRHGETYDLTVRAGLPSNVDETLPSSNASSAAARSIIVNPPCRVANRRWPFSTRSIAALSVSSECLNSVKTRTGSRVRWSRPTMWSTLLSCPAATVASM